MAGLHDRSSYVRRTAVMGCLKVFYVAPEFVSGLYVNNYFICIY